MRNAVRKYVCRCLDQILAAMYVSFFIFMMRIYCRDIEASKNRSVSNECI